MPKATTTRSERIEIRTKPEIKSVIERAAQLRNTSISAYLIETAFKKAQADLRETENLVLNESDRTLFFSLINAPPVPNPALKSLFQSRDE